MDKPVLFSFFFLGGGLRKVFVYGNRFPTLCRSVYSFGCIDDDPKSFYLFWRRNRVKAYLEYVGSPTTA
jgi:hypothetical protein